MAKELKNAEAVDAEIAKLLNSRYVKLARMEEAVRNRRMLYLNQLREYEKKGKMLAERGVTFEELNDLDAE